VNDDTPETAVEPEVRVRSMRRRRSEPPPIPVQRTPPVRSWLIYLGLAFVVTALALDGFLSHHPGHAELPTFSQATEVRSAISQVADSLQVVVSWDLTLADSAGQPNSVRVKVIVDKQRRDSLVSIQPASQLADTLHLPAPAVGQTVSGVSCAAADHPPEQTQEACTPWQYVRPTTEQASGAVMTRIVIQPSGLQVDPDVEGSCARWQQTHPADSVWIEVNRTAVPECTGPNRKPTVAQFCAFAVLPDGRRVKTANSMNNPYCEELFEEWIRERFS
jgi:hypothetical protein